MTKPLCRHMKVKYGCFQTNFRGVRYKICQLMRCGSFQPYDNIQ